MPTIDEFEIPAALLSELLGIVDQAKAGPLLALAKKVPAIGRGFRLNVANSKFIRQRLAAKLADSPQLSEEIRVFLAQEGLNIQLVMVLSKFVLLAGFTELLVIYGRERFLAAVLVDTRPEVRQLAVDYCLKDDWQTRSLPDRLTAIATLSEMLQPFLIAINSILNEVAIDKQVSEEAEILRNEITGCRQKIADLEERLQKVRDDKKTDRKLEGKAEAFKRQIAELVDKLARERQGRMKMETALAHANTSLADFRKAHDEEVRAGIEAEMQAVVRAWLVEPLRLDNVVEELMFKAGEDILERAKVVLVSQGERDRHYGNRSRLRRRLAELRQAEATLLQAASEAINPLPELSGLIDELQAEVARIEALLDEKIFVNPMVQRFAALIKQADSQDDLERIRRLLQDLDASGCLSQMEIRQLYRDYHHCLGRLFDRFAPRPLTTTAVSDPALIVSRSLSKEEKVLWLLDGYNILFSLEDIFADSYEDGRPAAQARKCLLNMVQVLLAGTDSFADVFFDGEVQYQENFSTQVKVVYSGGGGLSVRNRADGAIIDCLERQRPGTGVTCVVVTNDRELGKHCELLGARVIPLQEFAAYLKV